MKPEEPQLPLRVVADAEFDRLERSPDKVYIISTKAACKKLGGICRQALYRRIKAGELPKPFALTGKVSAGPGAKVYFFEKDIDDHLYQAANRGSAA